MGKAAICKIDAYWKRKRENMLFNSYPFIFLFLPVTAIVYFALNRFRWTVASKTWLALASLFFYGYWNVKYIPLILGSIVFNYGIGRFDFPGASHAALMNSIHSQLMVLPDETTVLPGHGPDTTIGNERNWNPFLRE